VLEKRRQDNIQANNGQSATPSAILLDENVIAASSSAPNALGKDWRSPLPLHLRCASCLIGKIERVFISFDGNFQQKRMADTLKGPSVLGTTKIPDLRLFILPSVSTDAVYRFGSSLT
jgi:hypothetical protein